MSMHTVVAIGLAVVSYLFAIVATRYLGVQFTALDYSLLLLFSLSPMLSEKIRALKNLYKLGIVISSGILMFFLTFLILGVVTKDGL